jgi:ribosome-binding factor A
MKNQNLFKKERLATRIQQELSLVLRAGHLSDQRFKLVALTKVELNVDCSLATVYWDTYAQDKVAEITMGLKHATAKLRCLLALALAMRTVPELRFKYDASFSAQDNITNILKHEAAAGKFAASASAES